jgi:hypothetical protein
MCPVCAVNAATAVASVTTAGEFASFAVRIFRYKRNTMKSGLKEITRRSDEHGYCNETDGTTEGCATG